MDERLERAYFEYDSEQDPNGSRGMAIADAVLERCGNSLDKLVKWAMMHRISYLGKNYAIDNPQC